MHKYQVLYAGSGDGTGQIEEFEAADFREEGSLIFFYVLSKPIAAVRTAAILSIRRGEEVKASDPDAASG